MIGTRRVAIAAVPTATAVLVLGLLAGPMPGAAETVIAGTVRSKDGRPLPGLALLEKGEIHGNVWDRGALVDQQGRFQIVVADGGPYGLHVYASGYIYSPQALKVQPGQQLEVSVVLVPEPTRANTPVIQRVEFPPAGRSDAALRLDVFDPNGILGPQVLAFNAATGRAHALDPPRWVWSLKSNYPNGVYRLKNDAAGGPVNPRDWYFVVADHQCNTSDILAYPHEPKPQEVVRPSP